MKKTKSVNRDDDYRKRYTRRSEAMTRIDACNRRFIEKLRSSDEIKNVDETEEIVSNWYKQLESFLAYYLWVNSDKEWSREFSRLDYLIKLPVNEIKQLYLKDEACEKIVNLKSEIYNAACVYAEALKKDKGNAHPIDVSCYTEKLNGYLSEVRYFNRERIKKVVDRIKADLAFLSIGDINKASREVWTYHRLINGEINELK